MITPNIPEAEVLTKTKIKNSTDMIKAANILLKLGAKNVLIKGGHLKSKVIQDILVTKKTIKIFKNKKIDFRFIREELGGFLFIYSLRGIFLALPIFFIAGWIGGSEFIREFWLYIFIAIIAIQFVFINP